MSDSTFSSIALDVVGQYQQAGQHLIRAYRGGSERLVQGLRAQSTKVIGNEGPDMVADLTIRSLDSATDIAGRAVNRLAEGVAKGIERVGGTTDRLEAKLDGTALEIVTALPRKAAATSLQIAGKVSELSQQLSVRLAGEEEAAPVAKPARKTAAKKAARRTRRAA